MLFFYALSGLTLELKAEHWAKLPEQISTTNLHVTSCAVSLLFMNMYAVSEKIIHESDRQKRFSKKLWKALST